MAVTFRPGVRPLVPSAVYPQVSGLIGGAGTVIFEAAGTAERLLYTDAQLSIVLKATAPVVLALHGDIDITNSGAVALTLARSRQGDAPVIVDTGALDFVDLSGLRVLTMPSLPFAQRWIRLENVTPHQRRLLHLTGWG
jgi:anti-anti-sigma factor